MGQLLIKKKSCPFLKEKMSLAAAQLIHQSRLKKGHVFFLISNRPNIHISNKCNNSIFLYHTSYSMHLMSKSDAVKCTLEKYWIIPYIK